MNKLFKIVISNILILFSLSVYAYAVTGAADVYKVTMRKVELCTGSTGVSSCDNAVVIGSGDKEVDIASVSAGAAAASYGEPALLPLGETYTHMRVTIDRKFTIKNSTAIAAGENATACRTIATTTAMYGGTAEATRKYTHKPVVANNQTAAEMNIYLVNDQYTRCNVAGCSGDGGTTDDQSISYAQGTGSSKHQSQHADGSTDDDHVMIYELTSPYTVALIAPKIDISFGTSAAVSAQEVNELCQIWAEEPVVTITIE
jgi:hypothetical protein